MLFCLLPGKTASAASESELEGKFSGFAPYALWFNSGGSSFFSTEENVNDGTAYAYALSKMYSSSDYDKYETEEDGKFEMPYSVFMELLDSLFVNHSDMKDYLNSKFCQGSYDAETDTVVIVQYGGQGGPNAWPVTNIYQDGNTYYVQGLSVDYGYLAALLRCKSIPAGFCYQKLVLDDEADPVLIYHGLNGVYIKEYEKWIRLDARENKDGVNAQFSMDKEQLTFLIRPEKGEEDCFTIYPDPDLKILESLKEILWKQIESGFQYIGEAFYEPTGLYHPSYKLRKC